MGKLLENGIYDGIITKFSAGPRKNGRLTLYSEVDVAGTKLVHQNFLESNDGVISPDKIVKTREVYPLWNGTIEELFNPANFENVEVSITVKNEDYANEETGKSGTYTKIEWLNPRGKGGGTSIPEPGNKNELVAKYGATLRALTPQAVKAPAAKPKAPPAAKPKGPPPAKKADGPAPTMEECWAQAVKAYAGDETQAEVKWNELIAGREYDQINADGWRDVMKALAEILPY